MPGPTLEVLICTIPHRHAKLIRLLAELDRQAQPGFAVRLLRDNMQAGRIGMEFHRKRQRLLESSSADYVCDLDDDDWVAEDYVAAIMAALKEKPDYVGFEVDCTWNGGPWKHAYHSLVFGGHDSIGNSLYRDITHLNPMRRELALLGRWGKEVADDDWAAQIRATGQVKTQVLIERVMYHYRCNTADRWDTERGPMPEPLPQLPEYPWLTVLG